LKIKRVHFYLIFMITMLMRYFKISINTLNQYKHQYKHIYNIFVPILEIFIESLNIN